jgi:hypothetical protein
MAHFRPIATDAKNKKALPIWQGFFTKDRSS